MEALSHIIPGWIVLLSYIIYFRNCKNPERAIKY